MSDDKKVHELEKEFRETVVSELRQIKSGQEVTKKELDTLNNKVSLHVQKTEYELQRINDQDSVQNKLLAEHIAGVNTLKEMYSIHDKKDEERFDRLEENNKFFRKAIDFILRLGGVVGALYTIFKIFKA